MEWRDLLSASRFDGRIFQDSGADTTTDVTNHFRRDPDRVLFSSAFRRLQGKTQVYLFPRHDFVRNRLTHTLEVASIGRSLASSVYRRIFPSDDEIKRVDAKGFDVGDFGDIVYAACLAHDLGNPPFGHIGEYAIRSYFQGYLDNRKNPGTHLHKVLSSPKGGDLLYFEGNAQSLRVVTRLQGWGYELGGLRLTAATIGAMVKYPYSSGGVVNRSKQEKKKFGINQEEIKIFDKIAENLRLERHTSGAGYVKHPLAFITEAADDIAYLTSDIEDAWKYKYISFKVARRALKKVVKEFPDFIKRKSIYKKIPDEKGKIAYLRSFAAMKLTQDAVDCFVANHQCILEGKFEGALVDNKESFILRSISEKYIYYAYPKVRAEAGAFEVVNHVLGLFTDAIESKINHHHSKMIHQQDSSSEVNYMSERFKSLIRVMDQHEKLKDVSDPYELYMALVDFISGSTDRYILDVFETVTGKKISNGY